MTLVTKQHLRVQLKRAYAPPCPEDGVRVLVDHLWPCGLRKSAPDDSLILPHRANPRRIGFSRTTRVAGAAVPFHNLHYAKRGPAAQNFRLHKLTGAA